MTDEQTMIPTSPMVFSIRAEYCARILAGSKRWEFRTRMPRVSMGDVALIYESRGRGRIVAAFTVGSLLHPMSPGALWQTVETMDPGSHGISRDAYDRYFEGRSSACAIGVESVVPLDIALPENMCPPQSWARWRGPWPLGVGA